MGETKTVSRSRWAAVGAAVAVCLGAGGVLGVSAATTSSTLTPVAPVRILDTRGESKVGDLDDGASTSLQVTGTILTVSEGSKVVVPERANAITANLTVTETSTGPYGGYATIYPCGDVPNASTLNFVANQTVANSVAVPLSELGSVCIFVFGEAHVILDVSGYYSSTDLEDLATRVSVLEGAEGSAEAEQRIESIESDLANLMLTVEDRSGDVYTVYKWRSWGSEPALRSESFGMTYIVDGGKNWWIGDPDAPNANGVQLKSYFLESDCSGEPLKMINESLSVTDDGTAVFHESAWTSARLESPLAAEGTGENGLAEGTWQVEYDLDNTVDLSNISSYYFNQGNDGLGCWNFSSDNGVTSGSLYLAPIRIIGPAAPGVDFPLSIPAPIP